MLEASEGDGKGIMLLLWQAPAAEGLLLLHAALMLLSLPKQPC